MPLLHHYEVSPPYMEDLYTLRWRLRKRSQASWCVCQCMQVAWHLMFLRHVMKARGWHCTEPTENETGGRSHRRDLMRKKKLLQLLPNQLSFDEKVKRS